MVRITALFFAVIILSAAVRATAADVNTRTCALTKAMECTIEEGCQERTIEEMALPSFVGIDVKAGTIISLDRNMKRETTKIVTTDRRDGMIVMHGTEKRGWSIALKESTGELTIGVVGAGEVFSVFGACMNP